MNNRFCRRYQKRFLLCFILADLVNSIFVWLSSDNSSELYQLIEELLEKNWLRRIFSKTFPIRSTNLLVDQWLPTKREECCVFFSTWWVFLPLWDRTESSANNTTLLLFRTSPALLKPVSASVYLPAKCFQAAKIYRHSFSKISTKNWIKGLPKTEAYQSPKSEWCYSDENQTILSF